MPPLILIRFVDERNLDRFKKIKCLIKQKEILEQKSIRVANKL